MEREQIIALLKNGIPGVAQWNSCRCSCEPLRLDRVCLRAADLRGVNFCRVRLFRAELSDAILREAQLEGADLSEAELKGADFTGACLASAKLFRCRLERAILRHANLEGAYLGEAELDGADLRGARLRTATGLTISQLRNVHLDAATALPASLAAEFAALPRERREAVPPMLRMCLEG